MIRQLMGGGYLALDVAGYGGLSLTPKGQALARGEGSFRYRQGTVPSSRKAERARKLMAAVESEGVSDELLQRLKKLRARIARERGVPAYVIFADRTLIDMAAKRPLTRWDFGEVHGVGESKLMQFAEVFLAEIRGFVGEGQ